MKNKNFTKSFYLYSLLSLFILGWWTLAFRPSSSSSPSVFPKDFFLSDLQTHEIFRTLSTLQRSALQQALSGNAALMMDFITQWESDAKVLQKDFGIKGIQRLNQEDYLKAQLLTHLILTLPQDQLREINCKLRKPYILDATGRQIQSQDSFCRFLPQTYMTANILLAIAKTDEIIAIPKGLRQLNQLYTAQFLDQIPLDADRCHSEKLFLANPHMAFVSPYSHPASVQALSKQKIPLYHVQTVLMPADIQKVILEIGHICNHPVEAQLLSIFIEAGLLSIDNRLKALSTLPRPISKSKKLLYLCHYQQYYMPTKKCITGQLLERALQNYEGLTTPTANHEDWMVPYDREKIFNMDPDYLILSIANADQDKSRFKHQQSLQNLTACKNNQIAFVDESLQDSPTQFVVLAYYDLFESIGRSILVSQ
jgi:iron complex transport system substrate-binding protein